MKHKNLKAPVKTKIRRGDIVRVIAGDEKGQRGKVLRVVPETGRALIEGINLVKRHLRKSQEHPHGRIAEMEAPIALSNLARVAEREEKKTEKPA
jgi:large subunit ribosomal protein L24